ncbi:uncharacterized protein METZ01_LOCUS238417, partial [marine metagenome]
DLESHRSNIVSLLFFPERVHPEQTRIGDSGRGLYTDRGSFLYIL